MWGSSITFEDLPLELAVTTMAELGFTRVEMWKHHLRRCRTPELRQAFAKYAATMGIRMGGLNVVGEDYYRPFGTDEEWQQTLGGLRSDVDYALSLGSSDVLVWEGVRPKGLSNEQCKEQLLPRLVKLFREAIAYASPKGMRFLVEPHPFTVGMADDFLIALCDSLDPMFLVSPSTSVTTASAGPMTMCRRYENWATASVISISLTQISKAPSCISLRATARWTLTGCSWPSGKSATAELWLWISMATLRRSMLRDAVWCVCNRPATYCTSRLEMSLAVHAGVQGCHNFSWECHARAIATKVHKNLRSRNIGGVDCRFDAADALSLGRTTTRAALRPANPPRRWTEFPPMVFLALCRARNFWDRILPVVEFPSEESALAVWTLTPEACTDSLPFSIPGRNVQP